jgi:nucleoside 2-deoxyribosyltransferase
MKWKQASKRIYLAGFDVFRTDACAYGQSLKELCRQHGFEGLYPMDHACPAGLTPQQSAQWIYASNLKLIRQADLLIANLNNFRGWEPDSGTCFEIGFAVALDIPTWAYFSGSQSLLEQIPHRRSVQGDCVDEDGYLVEDFGLPRNLMLSCSTTIVHGELEDCLMQIVAASSATTVCPSHKK